LNTDIRASEGKRRRAGAPAVVDDRPNFAGNRWPQLTLAVLTLVCLLPFSGKAVHIDDPLFVWTAKQIVKHPLNPYGFTTVWFAEPTPMWQSQENPPVASYYLAVVGAVGGWSERVLHIGFLVPALIVVLGTYRLARRFTRNPFLAAAAVLVAPAFLVSATSLMCDVPMLALWILAVLFWLDGLDEPVRPLYLAISGVLIGACALTKYFGVALIPLLLVYSLVRQRKLGSWIGYLAIPVVILCGYEFYTQALYGRGLIREALQYHSHVRELEGHAGRALVGLVFAGGCALPALMFLSFLWSRKQIFWGAVTSAALSFSFFKGWVDLGSVYLYESWLHEHLLSISLQMFFYAAGGISVLALAVLDWWKKRDAASLLLLLWVGGTIFFAVVVNWTVNARSMLPMIPAVAILIARRIDDRNIDSQKWRWAALSIPLILSGIVSLWVAQGDTAMAETARTAAHYIQDKTRGESGATWFEGRWGFEYYMLETGARPLIKGDSDAKFGDLAVIPKYNTSVFVFAGKTTGEQSVDFDVHSWATAMNPDAGAGFYFSGWGPLPFVFGPVPPQRYFLARIVQAKQAQ
jgi:4-amino-4-deoxy-L-arabinose transferase-like glycosyltransferase